ncbi:hypothetical protein [Clostridium chauvoei]|uniref:Uncharacterized protein n=2 Tax=Clostridium chauvoei TaxID=46867 RepID=S6EYT6_9CLOT|nr:hypothetical protein [Clostridium chauvoei]ATD54813.1 hypothetical protein BTM20_06020 [Clostridium chauvoei]ATD57507.1 hypothetical protein BTM21_07040 [Clostridium chauvoei]MBX7281185.1 hypothetical protein [Clostridium chauvoei]MBX7283639.1 hypothetical protein [Clostridium chauvoei]MBX7286247.1 hypothetical protein [Clostridium chauvoei]
MSYYSKGKYPNDMDNHFDDEEYGMCEKSEKIERPEKCESLEKANFCDFDKPVFEKESKKDRQVCNFEAVKTISFRPCDIKEKENITLNIDCTGRILTLNVFLKDVCINNTVLVGILLCDKNEDKIIGFKVKKETVPQGKCDESTCRDFYMGKFTFIVPEEELCSSRKLKVKVIAQYTDIDLCK